MTNDSKDKTKESSKPGINHGELCSQITGATIGTCAATVGESFAKGGLEAILLAGIPIMAQTIAGASGMYPPTGLGEYFMNYLKIDTRNKKMTDTKRGALHSMICIAGAAIGYGLGYTIAYLSK